jgi:hypothetical protein
MCNYKVLENAYTCLSIESKVGQYILNSYNFDCQIQFLSRQKLFDTRTYVTLNIDEITS